MDTLWKDIQFGFRMLRRRPGFTAVAIITLALGMGANTAIFSVVNAVLLRPLPYKEADRLAVILHRGHNPVAAANFVDWRHQNHVFESMGAAEYWTPNLTGIDQPEHLWALKQTSDIFPLLGVPPLIGRVFLPEEDERGKEHVVVLSYRLWQRRFSGDKNILGQTVALDGENYTVVGVMPRHFMFAPFWATKAELWVPLALGDRVTNRGSNSLRVFARLKSGITLDQARSEMAAITGRLEKEFPGTNRDVTVLPLKEKVVGRVRPALLVLLTAVGFVLLISCANVSHMLLARAADRQKEIAIRTALGAGRSRMVRQFLTESLALALMGGGVGLLLAMWGIRVLVALSPATLPRVETIGLDGRVFLFLLGATILAGLAFGLVPARQASTLDVNDSLKEGGRGLSKGIHRSRSCSLLVISEFALALVLLAGAGLMVRSIMALQAIDPGFNPGHLLTMVVSVAGSQEVEPHRRATFYLEVLQRIRAIPGVVSASAINHLPLAGDIWGWPFAIEGRPLPHPGESPTAVYRVVLPRYFDTMNIPIIRGRDIGPNDTPGAPGAVVINERLVRECFPGEDPIGKRITLDDPPKVPSWFTIVGVVKDARQEDWTGIPESEIYLPFLQNRPLLENPASPFAYLTVVARTSGEPAAIAPSLEREIWSVDKSVTISQVQTMDQVVAESNTQPRFYLLLLSVFASVAMVLAAVGIYGVISYSVSSRTHEVGVRMALGAQARDVLKLVVGQGLRLALIGLAIGVMGALILTRLMRGLLYGVSATDPVTFSVITLALVGVALLACYLPARRATRIDPMVALRSE
ncbi:MAG: ABC transporter permease [Terriglobia bacterium]